MAVKSIRLADAASGNRMQVVDASEVDSEAFATVMERVVSGSLKLPTTIGTAIRGASAAVGADTSVDTTALDAGLLANLIEVGDGSLLVVHCDMTLNGTITVTPIVFDDQVSPSVVTVLASKTFSCSTAFRRGTGAGNYVAAAQVWDVLGAHKIGLSITSVSAANTCILYGSIL